jgi:hypothetical protein
LDFKKNEGFMKKILILICSFVTFSAFAVPCGRALLVTPNVATGLSLSEKIHRESEQHFKMIKSIVEDKGFQVENPFFLKQDGMSDYDYDYIIVVTSFQTYPSDLISGFTYYANVYSASRALLQKGLEVTRGFSLIPNKSKWLKKVINSLNTCN